MKPKEGDESHRERHANGTGEHRPSPPNWIVGLVLFEEIDQAKVEVLVDGGNRDYYSWIARRG